MNKNNLINKIEPFILDKIIKDTPVVSKKLGMSHNRFDIAFKLAYIESFNNENTFDEDCYNQHIKAFTLGKYTEKGRENKKSINDYQKIFKEIFSDIKENGFDSNKSIIPLAHDATILNGAHRIASAIYLNLDVDCLVSEIPPVNYNYEFFKNRGVTPDILDYISTKFIDYSNNTYLAFIWPSAKKNDLEIEKILNKIVYKKSVKLNHNGAHNLLAEAYAGEKWLGNSEDNYPGIINKLTYCFPDFDDVRIYLFQADSLNDVLLMKDKIRDIFGIGKHSIHITDNKHETKKLASLVFNNNSVDFLNNGKPREFNSTIRRVDEYNNFLHENNMSHNDYVLVSGIVMALYGIREAKDIDYVTLSEVVENETIDFHEKEYQYHDCSISDLIYNPNNFFYFYGIKVITLDKMKKMKKKRGEKKDLLDLDSIEHLNKRNFMSETIIKYRYKLLYTKSKMKHSLIVVAKKLKLYETIKFFYLKLKV